MPHLPHDETSASITTLRLDRTLLTMVVRRLPTQASDNYGEDYIEEATIQQALTQA